MSVCEQALGLDDMLVVSSYQDIGLCNADLAKNMQISRAGVRLVLRPISLIGRRHKMFHEVNGAVMT